MTSRGGWSIFRVAGNQPGESKSGRQQDQFRILPSARPPARGWRKSAPTHTDNRCSLFVLFIISEVRELCCFFCW